MLLIRGGMVSVAGGCEKIVGFSVDPRDTAKCRN